ncbi:MFS transporter [Clostridium formicaceticum]|uniref:Methyl viologen resistance protein SmvA n=1 Tax=Clostridium formicaceticum TaxID=1497 RepID=A0AAC9RL74_9CLOT|nr:MFS transporter [Clostridium formicaceticum]AOY74761.1 hypothetical protein BJL90_01600 [Clostridium formicaceticum]ARE89149.1 Methyl viologen resistance protein SmvA [Clostridium formicaceticum]
MRNAVLKIAVLSISLLSLTITSASVALGDISLAFPDAGPNTIKLIVSLPALLIIPFTLLCGKLSNAVSKRKLLFTGLSLFLIGGVGPSFSNNLIWILILRAILGIGMGFIMPLATGLIADFFDGEERAAMMGLQSAVVNTGAIITSLVAGFLSAIDWHYVFLVYLIGVLVFVVTFFKLPDPEQPQETNTEKEALNRPVYVIAFVIFVHSLLLFSFFTNTAMVITEEGLGNAASAGIAITLMTVGGLIAGIFFGKILQCLKKFVIPLSAVLTGIGFFMLSYPQGLNLMLIASIIIGIGFGTTMPAVMIKTSMVAPKSATTLAIAVVTSAMSLGQFISPFVLSFVEMLFAANTGRFSFVFAGFGILAGGLVLCLLVLRPEKAFGSESN